MRGTYSVKRALDVFGGDSCDPRCVTSSLTGRHGAELTPAVDVSGVRVLGGVAAGINSVVAEVVIVVAALGLVEKVFVDLCHEAVVVAFRRRAMEAEIQVPLVLSEGEVFRIALVGRVQVEPVV